MKTTPARRSTVCVRLPGGVEVKATGATRDEAMRAILAACAQADTGEGK